MKYQSQEIGRGKIEIFREVSEWLREAVLVVSRGVDMILRHVLFFEK